MHCKQILIPCSLNPPFIWPHESSAYPSYGFHIEEFPNGLGLLDQKYSPNVFQQIEYVHDVNFAIHLLTIFHLINCMWSVN